MGKIEKIGGHGVKNGKWSVIDIVENKNIAQDTSTIDVEAWQEGANFNSQKCLDQGLEKRVLHIRGRSR